MKIAFSAYGNNWREQVDIRFGRAKGFFIVDTITDVTTYIDNRKNIEVAQGAGTSAAQTLVEAGVKELITGKVGPKAGVVLKTSGVKVLTGIGYTSIEDAYQRYKRGMLTEQRL